MKKIRETIKNIRSNFVLKSYITAAIAFFINIAFFVYNLIFGIINNSVWNWSISIYYALLTIFRAIILYCEKRWYKTQIEDEQLKRVQLFKKISWCMIILDLSLIAPISLMVMSKREVSVGLIPTVAIAAYTMYKIILAIINFKKKQSKENLSVKALRQITLKDAIVSVLTMQNTMIMEFSENNSMLTLTAITSAGMLIILLAITLTSIITAYKNQR